MPFSRQAGALHTLRAKPGGTGGAAADGVAGGAAGGAAGTAAAAAASAREMFFSAEQIEGVLAAVRKHCTKVQKPPSPLPSPAARASPPQEPADLTLIASARS